MSGVAVRSMRQKKRFNESGSTLVEVLVALTVLSVVLIATGLAMASSLQIQNRNESRDKAVQLVQQQLEKARQVQFTRLGFLSGEGGVLPDPGYTPTATAVNGGNQSDATSAPCQNTTTRNNCTVNIKPRSVANPTGLQQFQSGEFPYQTERIVPFRELLYDEAGGVGGVDYTIRTNITWVDPTSYGVESTLPLTQRPKKITVTVYWTETVNNQSRVLNSTMSMIRTPNPGEWNDRTVTP